MQWASASLWPYVFYDVEFNAADPKIAPFRVGDNLPLFHSGINAKTLYTQDAK
jgi:hypothetical protein